MVIYVTLTGKFGTTFQAIARISKTMDDILPRT
jgi:hypothetical protein